MEDFNTKLSKALYQPNIQQQVKKLLWDDMKKKFYWILAGIFIGNQIMPQVKIDNFLKILDLWKNH